MARKPLSELTPAYRKRIESAEARGKTRQQARGKPPAEHIQRQAREVLRYGVTSQHRAIVRKFAEAQARRINTDKNIRSGEEPRVSADRLYNDLMTAIGTHGYDAVIPVLKAEVRGLTKIKRRRVRISIRRGQARIRIEMTPRSPQVDRMAQLAARLGLPDWRILFYH